MGEVLFMINLDLYDPAKYIAEIIIDRANTVVRNPESLDLEQICDRIPKEVFQEYLNIAASLVIQRRYQDAADVYFFLTQLNSISKELWMNLGMCYQILGQFEFAIDSYLKAIAVDPANWRPYLCIIGCFKEMKMIDDGLEFINEIERGIIESEIHLHLLEPLRQGREQLLQSDRKRRK